MIKDLISSILFFTAASLLLLVNNVSAFSILSAETQNTNKNSQIEKISILFDEQVDPSSIESNGSDFLVSDGYIITNAATSANPFEVVISLQEKSLPDTDITPNIEVATGQVVSSLESPDIIDPSSSSTITNDGARAIAISLDTPSSSGSYQAGQDLIFEAVYSEPMTSQSTTITFDNGKTVPLISNGTNTASGTYTIASEDDSLGLSIVSSNTAIKDANNLTAHEDLPIFAPGKTLKIDTISPVLSQVTTPPSPSSDNTPTITFNSSEAGAISYGGGCSSPTTTATGGNNTLTLNSLADGTYTGCTISVTDDAGNIGLLNLSPFTIDTEAPLISRVSIRSNNVLNSSLAKTNDTIFIDIEYVDNSSVSALPTGTILSRNFTGTTSTANTITLELFTNGTESSEIITPFSIQLQDIAGNITSLITSTTDGSSVQFDRTNPLIQLSSISAISSDSSAFLGDLPRYYAKQADSLVLEIQAMDYVNVLSMTGTIFGQPVSLSNTSGNIWQTTLLNINGAEGQIPFNISVQDNAGNEIQVTGTTDPNNKVIFDRTAPINPILVNDLQGGTTNNFKHRSKAVYSWSGQTDGSGVGIISYDIRFSHPDLGVIQDTVVPNAGYSAPQPLAPQTNPYALYLNTNDKAGNKSPTLLAYTQKYSIAVIGKILDKNGAPLSNAFVQIASRFGETCNNPAEICQAKTGNNGEVFIVVEHDQDYTFTAWHHRYYLEKKQTSTSVNDLYLDARLQGIQSPHEVQEGNQTVVIHTKKIIPSPLNPDIKIISTVSVGSLSGEISTKKIDETTFEVTSLSRIIFVESNDPDVVIINHGNNTYTVKNTGVIERTSSLGGREGSIVVTHTGQSPFFNSSGARLGVINIPGNGKANGRRSGQRREDYIGQGQIISYEESLAYAKKQNEGYEGQIHSYVNRNGYVVFSGYQSGRIPLDQFPDRFQNDVLYRGGYRESWKNYEKKEVINSEGETILKKVEAPSLKERMMDMKEKYQHPKKTLTTSKNNPNTKEFNVTHKSVDNNAGIKKGASHNNVILGVMTKKINDKSYVNKFEIKRSWVSTKKSRIKGKNPSTIKLKGSDGKLAMNMLFPQ